MLIVTALHNVEQYIADACKLLNNQWPLMTCVRMATLKRSRDSLPTSLVLIKDNQVIGHARLKHLDSLPRAAYVESFVVDPICRGLGYGRLLMEKTEEYAIAMGFEALYLYTRDKQGFYEALGYEVCGAVPLHGQPWGDSWLPDVRAIHEIVFDCSLGNERNSKSTDTVKLPIYQENNHTKCYQLESDLQQSVSCNILNGNTDTEVVTPQATSQKPNSDSNSIIQSKSNANQTITLPNHESSNNVTSIGPPLPPPPPPLKKRTSNDSIRSNSIDPPTKIDSITRTLLGISDLEHDAICMKKFFMKKELC